MSETNSLDAATPMDGVFPEFPYHIQIALQLQRYSQHEWVDGNRECLHQAFIIEGEDARETLAESWETVYENPLILNATQYSLETSQTPEGDHIDGVLINGFQELKQTHLSSLQSTLTEQTSIAPDTPTLPAETPVTYIATPPTGVFEECDPLLAQIPISEDVGQQFDLLWPIGSGSLDREALRSSFIQEKLKGDDRPSVDTVSAKTIQSKQIDSVSDAAETTLDEFQTMATERLIGDVDNLSEEYSILLSGDVASKPTCKLAAASTVSCGDETITADHVEFGAELTRTSYNELGLTEPAGHFDADAIEDGQNQDTSRIVQDLKTVIKRLCDEAPEDEEPPKAYIGDILDRMTDEGYDADRVEHEVTKLCQKAELYESETDYYSPV